MKLSVGKYDYKYGLMDAEGNILLDADWGDAPYDGKNIAFATYRVGGQRYYLGERGTLISEEYYSPEPAEVPALKPVSHGGKYGYANAAGEIVIPCQFDFGEKFCEGYAAVNINGKQGLIDETGKVIYSGDYMLVCSVSDGLSMAVDNDLNEKIGFLNTDGSVAVPFIYNDARDFSEGLAAVYNGKWGYIDKTGSVVVPFIFDEAGSFRDGLASVSEHDECGVLIRKGILKNPLLADSVSPWASEDIEKAKAAGLVTRGADSYCTFGITRLKYTELLINLVEKVMGITMETDGADIFTDTHEDAAKKAFAVGIAQGTGDNIFSPNAIITREQAALMLWRAILWTMNDGERAVSAPAPLDLSLYTDGAEVSDWAKDAVCMLASAGIMKGTSDDKLSPKLCLTTEQAIMLMLRVYKKLGR